MRNFFAPPPQSPIRCYGPAHPPTTLGHVSPARLLISWVMNDASFLLPNPKITQLICGCCIPSEIKGCNKIMSLRYNFYFHISSTILNPKCHLYSMEFF